MAQVRVRGTSRGQCEHGWRGVRLIFAHFPFFELRSVAEQRQSCQSTRLFFDWEDSNLVTRLLPSGRDGLFFFGSVLPCTLFM